MQVLKFPSKKLNKKKMIVFISACSIFFILLVLSIIYLFNSSFRAFVDIYIFRKGIDSNNLSVIEINSNEDQFFHAYDKYIAVLNKNILYTYSASGNICSKNDVNISTPVFSSNENFLVVAENGGNNIYLISGLNVIWQNTVDGNISKINVNKNGYVSVIVSGTSYKSIVITFDSKGKELFKTYLSNNIAIDTDISNDNKYLSIGEIDYSGSIIKSMVKNISIEKAKTDPTNSIIYTYSAEENSLLIDIKYQDKNKLICSYQDSVHLINISDCVDNQIISLNENYEFIDIKTKNNFIYTYNETSGFNNQAIINIHNIHNNSSNIYKFKGSIKSIYVYGEKLAINTGTNIHFVGVNGWLIKKYSSYNEINNIILGDTIAGIVYKDKIEIIEI